MVCDYQFYPQLHPSVFLRYRKSLMLQVSVPHLMRFPSFPLSHLHQRPLPLRVLMTSWIHENSTYLLQSDILVMLATSSMPRVQQTSSPSRTPKQFRIGCHPRQILLLSPELETSASLSEVLTFFDILIGFWRFLGAG
ncbi:hypothetical protein ALC62_12395 [Cyphomyrmex costatus]|uniref:Uncharacterized protein n=1 Tax=Cyphomyrmex costatus TaxID=456900 RepID=A0A151IB92_9HYME|nr:hypothetical protein ALC62_12395 [Cyphomyrmex costatus]